MATSLSARRRAATAGQLHRHSLRPDRPDPDARARSPERTSTRSSPWPTSSWAAAPAVAWSLKAVAVYIPAQIAGGIGGTMLANLMFDLPASTASTHTRSSGHLWLGEVVATAGLVLLIFCLVRTGRGATVVAPAVGAYIGAAYWFTSSTSFANPAVDHRAGVHEHLRRDRARLGRPVRRLPGPRRRDRRGADRGAVPGGAKHADDRVAWPRPSRYRRLRRELRRPALRPDDLERAGKELSEIADRLAERFPGTFTRATVERYVVESYRALAASARLAAFLPALTERFADDRLVALAYVSNPPIRPVPQVLFICDRNAARSQMAAALLEMQARGRVNIRSAGSRPAAELELGVIEAMAEIGADLSAEYPKPLTDEFVARRRHRRHRRLRRRLPGPARQALPGLDRAGSRRQGHRSRSAASATNSTCSSPISSPTCRKPRMANRMTRKAPPDVRHQAVRAVRLHPQRRPLPDGRRVPDPPAPGTASRVRSAGSAPADQVNPAVAGGHERGRHRPVRRDPEDPHRRSGPGLGLHHHHGLRRHLPRLPRQEVPRLGPRPTPPARASKPSARSATRSKASSRA